jgi:hypothetical protein
MGDPDSPVDVIYVPANEGAPNALPERRDARLRQTEPSPDSRMTRATPQIPRVTTIALRSCSRWGPTPECRDPIRLGARAPR